VDNLDLNEDSLNVLDLCCAPGAKLSMICDRINRCGSVIGVDVSQERMNVTRRQFIEKYRIESVPAPSRLSLNLVCTNGVEFSSQNSFDRVLVDAECTHDGSIKVEKMKLFGLNIHLFS
jgi:16S rRNA (cytosine967-C5)-methyltransferase